MPCVLCACVSAYERRTRTLGLWPACMQRTADTELEALTRHAASAQSLTAGGIRVDDGATTISGQDIPITCHLCAVMESGRETSANANANATQSDVGDVS